MRILDINDQELHEPDLALGYLIPDRLLIKHHKAVAAQPAKMHVELSAQYANGGETWITVIDTPAAPAVEAWDEYEGIQRYIAYTPEQLEERAKPTALEVLQQENKVLKTQLEALEFGQAFQEECIVELANIIYA